MGETFSKREDVLPNEDDSNNAASTHEQTGNEEVEEVNYPNLYTEQMYNNNSTNSESQLEAMAVVSSSYLERDLATHYNECNICGLNFTSSHRLRRHALLHASQYTYPCSFCKESFITLAHLRDHIKTHPVDEHPFECSFCDKTFACESSLRMHMKDHTGVYRHTCEICHKIFAQKSFFLCHMWSHTSNRPNKCHFCDKIFFMPSNLRSHVKAHSQKDDYSLSECDFSSNSHSGIMAS